MIGGKKYRDGSKRLSLEKGYIIIEIKEIGGWKIIWRYILEMGEGRVRGK